MTTLGLDPGIDTSGYAVLASLDELLEAGTLSPDDPKAHATARIESLCGGLEALLERFKPSLVVIEWNSGKVNRRRHQGGGAGLAVHGAVTCGLWREALGWARQNRATVVTVDESQWTHGVRKEERALAVASMFPGLAWTQDRKHDVADAIGVALWKLKELCVRNCAR